MVQSQYTLQEIITACEDFNNEFGFVNYAEIGRRLGISRQAVQLRLRAAREQGLIDEYTHGRLRPPVRNDRVKMQLSVSPETKEFLYSVAARLDVHPSTVLEGAVNQYRRSLKDSLTASP